MDSATKDIAQFVSTSTRPIRVLCADDNALIAMDLQGAIDTEPDMQCVGCLHRADDLSREVEQHSPDVVLLDLTMPGRDPLEVLEEISRVYPSTRTVVFSGYSDPDLMDRAIEAGAWGYVVKSGDLTALIEAIRRVAQGEFALTQL